MIRVMIFLDRGGASSIDEWEPLGRIDISNSVWKTALSGGKKADYDVEIFKKRKKTPWMKLKVTDWPREAYHPWELVRCILNQAAITTKGGRI